MLPLRMDRNADGFYFAWGFTALGRRRVLLYGGGGKGGGWGKCAAAGGDGGGGIQSRPIFFIQLTRSQSMIMNTNGGKEEQHSSIVFSLLSPPIPWEFYSSPFDERGATKDR